MEPFILQKKAEILLNQLIYPMLVHFPKAEKFSLCQELKQSCYRVIHLSIQYTTALKRDRGSLLRKADTELKYLLVLVGVAREQRYITEKKALHLQRSISELGRICGGLLKSNL